MILLVVCIGVGTVVAMLLDEVTVLGNLGLYMHIYYYSSEEPAQRPCYYWNYSSDTGLPQLFSLK